jgi:hypothetical protein
VRLVCSFQVQFQQGILNLEPLASVIADIGENPQADELNHRIISDKNKTPNNVAGWA